MIEIKRKINELTRDFPDVSNECFKHELERFNYIGRILIISNEEDCKNEDDAYIIRYLIGNCWIREIYASFNDVKNLCLRYQAEGEI